MDLAKPGNYRNVSTCPISLCSLILFYFIGEKISYLTALAYQARHWKLGGSTGKLSGSDLSVVISKIPSKSVIRKLAKTANKRLAICPKELVHIKRSFKLCQQYLNATQLLATVVDRVVL